ncbi:Heterokaryon incompatibility protein 6, OR allele [Pseudocercospora fuligena]|uniref:Heterokaryon incompatibility protein 6, OR allele n=1 Tax=Pseudocercospora fuligena TaxID=685502 RepID=A0A8H6R5S7_9PEZI|nr:Heterokaryon incompatibility protein 6, OR allele [Pseudocercospora fuligena]
MKIPERSNAHGSGRLDTDTSPYSSLNKNGREVRLLRILPSSSNCKIRCKTITTELDAAPQYSAVSYAWGLDSSSHQIQLNGFEVSVRKNLYEFLLEAQAWSGGERRFYWIDALCIDQADNGERSHQVDLMAQIYSKADRVLVWLGPAGESSNLAMRCLANGSAPQKARDRSKTKAGVALLRLCQRAYWTRLWVLQELALAKAAIVICGADQVPWTAFKTILGEADGTSRIPRLDGDDNTPTLRSAAATMLRLVHQSYHKATLYEKIIETKHLECADVRDKVFALLGMPHNSGEEHIRPDYDEDISQLAATVLSEHHRVHLPVLKDEVEQQCRDLAEALRIDTKDLYTDDRQSAYLMSLPDLAYSCNMESTLGSHEPMSMRQRDSSQCLVTAAQEHPFVAKLWSASQTWQVLERRLQLAIRDGEVLAFKITVDALVNKYSDEAWVRRWHPYPSRLHDAYFTENLAVMLYHMQLIEEGKTTTIWGLLITASGRSDSSNEISGDDRFARLLLISALWGKTRTVQLALGEQRSRTDCKDEFGRSPLALALIHDSSEIVELLIRDGKCDPNCKIQGLRSYTGINSRIENPLHAAIRLQKQSCIEVLLKSNAVDINARDADGDTALHLVAISHDPMPYLEALLSRNGLAINIKHNAGETPLHLMCSRKDPSCAAEILLMRSDLDINARNQLGMTILHQLLSRSSFDDTSEELAIVSQLVEMVLANHDLNVYIQDVHGNTPLSSWIMHNYERRQLHRKPVCSLGIASRLLGNGFPDTRITLRSFSSSRLPLLYALVLSFEQADVLNHIHDVIRQSPTCLTEVDDDGNTVLHLVEDAAFFREILKWHHAPIDVRNQAGDPPLHRLLKQYPQDTLSHRRPSVAHHAEILRECTQSSRVDPNSWDADGNTLLHLVRDRSCLHELLKHPGINVKAKNDRGMTPLRHKMEEVLNDFNARWYMRPILMRL